MVGFDSNLIKSETLPLSTEEFLRQADVGSVTATLYSPPSRPELLNRTGRVVVNYGNQDTDDAARTRRYVEQAQRLGIDVRSFSAPVSDQRLHAKTYTGVINQQPTALISTANLSETALTTAFNNRAERIREYQGKVFQRNLAFQTSDRSLVQQVSKFQTALSTGNVPESSTNVLVNGMASQATAHKLARAKKGDRIILSGPYLDDPTVTAALLTAKAQGAQVTVISANPETSFDTASSGTEGHRRAINQLASSGIEVLTPRDDDPLLIHTKALSIVGESESLFAIGSHNFTYAAKSGRSVDLLLMLNDPRLARELYDALRSTEGVELFKRKAVEDTPSLVELRMTLKGMGGLYRTSTSGERGPNQAMPYYATRMDGSFFKFFNRESEAPAVNIYSNLYLSRTGKIEVPSAVRQMDKEISDPGLGYSFNRLVGQPVYDVGFGVIGSAVKSVGRFVDWALGFEYNKERERDRDDYYQGGIRRYFNEAYKDTYGQDRPGPFESIFGNLYQIGAGAAATLAFYVGVDLPLKYFKAMLETDHASMLLQLPGEAPNNWMARGVMKTAPAIRLAMFGPSVGGSLNKVIQDPSTNARNFTTKLYEEVYKPDNVMKDPTRVAKTQEGRVTSIVLGDEGLYAGAMALRRFDQVRFKNLTAPILEAISPYPVGSTHHEIFSHSLDRLIQTVGSPTEIVFEQRAEDKNVYRPVFKNLGVARMQEIAKRYDDIAALLPANLMYWVPPLRRMLDLEDFDPIKHMTVRDVVSFEDAVLWTERFYKQAGEILKNPAQSVRQVLKGWAGEIKLLRQERQLIKDARTQFSSTKFLYQNTVEDSTQALIALQNYGQQTYNHTSEAITNFLGEQRVVQYRRQIASQQKMLEQSPFRLLNETSIAPESKYKPFESEARHRVSSMRRILARVGIALLADRVADQFIFQPLGANLLTQIQAHSELSTDDGQIARFKFTGDLPKELVIGTQLAAGAAVGFLLPDIVDYGNRPSSLSTMLDPLRRFQSQLNRAERKIQRSASEAILEVADLQTARGGYHTAMARYKQVQADLQATRFRRVGLRFNAGAAMAAAFVSGFAMKTLALGAAYMLNLIHNREAGLDVSGINSYFSSTFERLTSEGIAKAVSREDYVNLALGNTLAEGFLKSNGGGQRIYTIATQLTTPFIQVPFLLKADGTTGRASLSVGLQLMPLLGTGITPALPFAVRLNQKEADGFAVANQFGLLTGFQAAAVTTRGIVSAMTFGSGLIYEKESAYERGLDYVGASTALALAFSRIGALDPQQRLTSRLGANHPLIKTIEETRALRRISAGAIDFSRKSIQFVYSLPVALFGSTGQAAMSVIKPGANLRIPNTLRKLAPYYLSLVMANMMSDPTGDYVGEAFSDPSYRLGATLGAGLLMGWALDRSGAFASTNELAAAFQQRTRGLSKVEYKRLVQDWLPSVKPGTVDAASVDDLIENLRLQDAPARSGISSRRLMSTIAAPALWEEAHRIERVKFMMQVNDGNLQEPNFRKLPYSNLKSIGGRIAAAGLALFGLRTAAHATASLMSEDVLRTVYSVPLFGSALRLLAGVEASGSRDGVRQAAAPQGAYGIANKFINTLSFGLFSLPQATGLYSDTTDPFLNLIGPLGATFKQHRTNYYVQYASSFSDISATSYEMVRGGNSGELMARTYGLIKSGQARDINEAIAMLRGASPRQKAAIYEGFTSSELQAAGQSSGISRALSIRQFRLRHLSNQRSSELVMDFLKEGYAIGRLGSDLLPGYNLNYKGYDPMKFMSQVDFMMEKSLPATKPEYNDPYEAFMGWFHKSQWKGRRIQQDANPFNLTQGLGSFNNAAWVSAPIGLLLAMGTFNAAVEITAKLSTYVSQSEISKLTEMSKLSRGRYLTDPYQYVFTSGNLPGTGRSALFQVDKKNRYTNIYRLPIDVDDVTGRKSPFELISNLSKSYRYLHNRLGKYFTNNYMFQVNALLSQMQTAPEDQHASIKKTFKTNVQNEVTKIVRQQMQRTVIKGSQLTLYQAFYGGTSKDLPTNVRRYVDEVKGMVGSALDEVLDEVNKVDLVGATDRYEQILRLNARFEQSDSLQQFLTHLKEPVRGRFDIEGDRRQWASWIDKQVDSTGRMPLGHIQRAQAGINFSGATARPWAEGFLSTTIRGVKGASMLTGAWVATGRSLYELFESSVVLLGGDSQPNGLRLGAGEQFVSGALYWGISAGVASVATMIGLGPLAALGLGIGSMLGLDYLKERSAGIKQFEQGLIKSVGGFLAHPVESMGRMADFFGAGAIVRGVGNAVATPISFVLSAVTSPIRFALENVAAPFLQDQNIGLIKDSLPIQFIKSMLLPRSVYAHFMSYEPRRSTLAGTEPFVGGNIALHLKEQQARQLQRVTSGDTYIDELLVYPLIMGRAATNADRFMSDRYFEGGNRVLSSFGLSNYRISQSLRLALERRQAMYDAQVIASSISRPPEPINLSMYSFSYGMAASLARLQLEDMNKPVTDLLATELGHTIQFLKQTGAKAGKALWRPAEWLLMYAGRAADRFKFETGGFRLRMPSLKLPSWNLPSFSLPRLGLKPPDMSPVADAALAAVDWVFDKGQSLFERRSDSNFVGRAIGTIGRVIAFPFLATAGFAAEVYNRLHPTLQAVQTYLSRMGIPQIDLGTSRVPDFFNDLTINTDPVRKSVSRWTRTAGEAMTRFTHVSSDGLSNLPKGLTKAVGFGGWELLTSILVDSRLRSLDSADPFKEYQRAYQEAGSAFLGFVVGGLVAAATRSPLLSLVGSLVGSFLGMQIGDALARPAYKNQEDYNPATAYVQQSLLTAGSATLMRLPELLKNKQFVRYGLSNLALSLLTGGIGPVTQLSLVHAASGLYSDPSRVTQFIDSARATASYLYDGARFLITGQLSPEVHKAARVAVRTVISDFATSNQMSLGVRTRIKGSRFAIDGSYASKYRSITLSSATGRVLGRAELGLRIRSVDLAQARFTLFHEVAHAVDHLGQMPRLTLEDLDNFLYQGPTLQHVDELKQLITRASEQSTTHLYRVYSDSIGADLLKQVYGDELSANVRALREFVQRHPEQVGDLLKVLRRTTDPMASDQYQAIIESLQGRQVSSVDPGIRYRRASRFALEKRVLGDALGAPVRFVKGFMLAKPNVQPLHLPKPVSVDISRWQKAVEIYNTSFDELPSGWRQLANAGAKAVGAYQATTSGADLLAAYAQNSVGRVVSNLEGVINPTYKAAVSVNARMGAGGASALSIIDSAFIGVDIFQGLQSIATMSDLNRRLARNPAQASAYRKELVQARNSQLGATLGSFLGAGTGFFLKSPLLGFTVGGAAGVIAPLLGFFGLSDRLAQQDIEAAQDGESIYDPTQPSAYTRINRAYLPERAVSQFLFRPFRRLARNVIKSTFTMGGKLGRVGYRALSRLSATGLALLSGGSAIALPVLARLAQVMGLGARGAWLITRAATRPIFSVLGQLGQATFRTLASVGRSSGRVINALLRPIFGGSSQVLRTLGRYSSHLMTSGARALGRLERFIGQSTAQAFQLITQLPLPSFQYWSDDLILPALRTVGSVGLKLGAFTLTATALLTRSLARSTGRLAQRSLRGIGTLAQFAATGVRPTLQLGFAALRASGFVGENTLRLTGQLLMGSARLLGRVASIYGRDLFTAARYFPGYLRSHLPALQRLGVGVAQLGLGLLTQGAHRLAGMASVFPHLLNLTTGATRLAVDLIGKPTLTATLLTARLMGRGAVTLLRSARVGVNFGLLKGAGRGLLTLGQFALQELHASARTAVSLGRSGLNLAVSSTKILAKATGALTAGAANLAFRTARDLAKGVPGLVTQAQTLVDYARYALPRFASSVWDTGRGLAGAVGQLGSGIIKGLSLVASLTSGVVRGITRTAGAVGRYATRMADQAIARLARYTPGLTKNLLAKGYKETALNVISPALDLGMLGAGLFKISNLNAHSSYAEVEEAYVQAGSAKGSLVGSVFGFFSAGALGDFGGSLLGQYMGGEGSKERARLRYEARDYGIVPVLEDYVSPLMKEVVVAGASGQAVGKVGSAAVGAYLERSAARAAAGTANRLDKILVGSSAAYNKAFRGQVAQASARFTRVLGKAPGAGAVSNLVKGATGLLGTVSKGALRILGPAIDVTRLGVGYAQSGTARTEAEYEVAIGRTGGALGSMAGMLIGAAGGPLGSIAGSLIGDALLGGVSRHLAREAYQRQVSARKVTHGQIGGAVIGAGLGLIGAGLLIAGGVVASAFVLPVLAVAAGVGLLAGAVVGGYSMLFGSKKQKDSDRRRDSVSPIRRGMIARSFESEDSAHVIKKANERVAVTQSYLHTADTKPKTALDSETYNRETSKHDKKHGRSWWDYVQGGIFSTVSNMSPLGIYQHVAEFHKKMLGKTGKAIAKGVSSVINNVSDSMSISENPGETLASPATTVQMQTRSVKGGLVLSQAEAYRLAALAIMEAPTRMGRLDVTQAVFNRINAPKVGLAGYGRNVTGVLFAGGQFEPLFGVSSSEVTNREGAIQILRRKRGMSRKTAEQMLDQYLADIANPTMMANARKHVGGRTDFKGTTMYQNMVKSEDKLRTYGENFFHIGSGQSYKKLAELEKMAPVAIFREGDSRAGQVINVPVAGASQSTKAAQVNQRVNPSGKVVPFKGIIVTSAVDASGEPGLDYVVENGRRGAQFGSLTPGRVIEVIANQNWESHLEAGGTRRGYGNRVIVRSKDPKTGQEVDLLYAHLDRVNVRVGQQVGVGTVLGTQGRTGSTTGAHVSVDFFAKDKNYASAAALAMRDRTARALGRNVSGLNQQVKQTIAQMSSAPSQFTAPTQKTSQAKVQHSTPTVAPPPVKIPTGLNARGKKMASYLNNPNVRAILDTVAYAEGLWGKPGGGYDLGFGYRRINNLSRHPYHGRELTPGGSSSASGRYQAMGDTWAEAAEKYGLRDFSAPSQDVFAVAKLYDRGILDKIAAGKIDGHVKRMLGFEWASFEGNPYGQGTPMGNWNKALPFFHKRVAELRGQSQVKQEMAETAPSTASKMETPAEATQPTEAAPTPQPTNAFTIAPSRQKRRRASFSGQAMSNVDSELLKVAAATQPLNIQTVQQMVAFTRTLVNNAAKQIKKPQPVAIQVATNRRPLSIASMDTSTAKLPNEEVQIKVEGGQVNLESFVFAREWISFTGMDLA